jgi:general stress protein 26
MDKDKIDRILDFLDTQKLTVISTSSGDMPEAALVAFAQDEYLNIYFQTNENTRKAKNLESNQSVAFVFGTSLDNPKTVQYNGTATRITDQGEVENTKQLFLSKDSPTKQEFFDRPQTNIYKVKPTWIAYSDYSNGKPEVFELTEFEK